MIFFGTRGFCPFRNFVGTFFRPGLQRSSLQYSTYRSIWSELVFCDQRERT
jgi:hypothetical protein